MLNQKNWRFVKLKSGSNLSKKLFYFLQWKPFKSDEKCFLTHLYSSYRSQDIYFFACTLWPCSPNLWVGFLGIPFDVGGGENTPFPCSKYISTKKYVVSENRPFSTKALLILLMSGFFCKKSAFFGKDSTFTLSNSVRAVLEIF